MSEIIGWVIKCNGSYVVVDRSTGPYSSGGYYILTDKGHSATLWATDKNAHMYANKFKELLSATICPVYVQDV